MFDSFEQKRLRSKQTKKKKNGKTGNANEKKNI